MTTIDLGQFFYKEPEWAHAMYDLFSDQMPDWMGAWMISDAFRGLIQTGKDQTIVRPGNLRIIPAGTVVFWNDAYVVPFCETTFIPRFRTLKTPPTWSAYPSQELRELYYKQHGIDEETRRSLKHLMEENRRNRVKETVGETAQKGKIIRISEISFK